MADPKVEVSSATETGNSAQAEVFANADAALEEAILADDALMGDLEDEDEDEEEKPAARAKEAEEEEAPEENDEGEDEPAAELDEDDGESEEEPAEDEEDELYDAIATLRRELRAPTSVLKSMPKAKLIAWAKSVADEKEAKADSTPEPAATNGKKESVADPAQGSLSDWETFSKEAAEELGVDEKALAPFKSLHAAVHTLLAQNGQLASQLKQATDAAREREGRATIDSQIRRLERRIPGLGKDEALQGRIVEEAVTQVRGLQALGKPVDIVSVFDKAAKLATGKRPSSRSDLGQLKRNGVSHGPTSRPGSMSGDLSENDYFEQALAMVDRGQKHRIASLKLPSNTRPKARY